MKISKKIFLIFIFVSILVVLFGGFCLAQRKLETIYPTVPGAETPTTTKTALPEYLKYVFTFAIMVSGLLAFGALIYGGFSYLTSAGNPSKMKESQDQIMAGFLGLIIILSSYLILNTINPQLVILGELPIEPGKGGVKIYTMVGCEENEQNPSFMVNQSMADLTDPKLEWGFDGNKITSIKFLGAPGSLSVTLWANTEFTGTETPVDYPAGDEDNCKPVTPSTYKSISLDWHLPGVYLYASDNCTGNKYGVDYVTYQGSSDTLPDFNDKIKSIKFRYGECDPDTPDDFSKCKEKYAAILHEHENLMGAAMLFDQDPGEENCQDVSGLGVSSITVYLKPVLDKDGKEIIIGSGVKFWEDKNYTKKYLGGDANQDGYYGDNESESNLNTVLRVVEVEVADSTTEGNELHEKFNDKVTSIEMDGHYVALLCDNANLGGKCEVFMTRDPDLRNNSIGQCGWYGRIDCLSSFIIKARK